jgi:hypothetical protein
MPRERVPGRGRRWQQASSEVFMARRQFTQNSRDIGTVPVCDCVRAEGAVNVKQGGKYVRAFGAGGSRVSSARRDAKSAS